MGVFVSIIFLIYVQTACVAVFVALRRKERAENQRRHFLNCLEKALVRPVD